MNIGICFGGYSPMHQGHLDLIMKSKKLNDITHVIVCGYDDDPRGKLLSLEKRYNIIRNFLQEETVKVHMINDTKLGIDESMCPHNWNVWLSEVEKNSRKPSRILENGQITKWSAWTNFSLQNQAVRQVRHQ